jgi:hypothetical protein
MGRVGGRDGASWRKIKMVAVSSGMRWSIAEGHLVVDVGDCLVERESNRKTGVDRAFCYTID